MSYEANYPYVPQRVGTPQPVARWECQLGDVSSDSKQFPPSHPRIPQCRPFTSPYKNAIGQFKAKKLAEAQKNFGHLRM